MAIADLVLGTMYFGTRTTAADSHAQLDRFVEAGGTTIDTANCYAFWQPDGGEGGQSEEVIGAWLHAHPGARDDLVIASKVGATPRHGELEGLSRRVVNREIDKSLTRLGLGRLDVYWAHADDRSTPLDETVSVLGELVRGGTVDRLGVSNHPTWRVAKAREIARSQGVPGFELVQQSASYVEPRPGLGVPGKDHRFGFVTDETRDLCASEGIELWSYSPLIQGSYDREDRPFPDAYDHPGTTRRLALLDELAGRYSVRRGQLVLAWLLHQQPVVRPIIGVSSLAQLDEAIAAAGLELDPTDVARLDAPM